jgi:hypothetical protein
MNLDRRKDTYIVASITKKKLSNLARGALYKNMAAFLIPLNQSQFLCL